MVWKSLLLLQLCKLMSVLFNPFAFVFFAKKGERERKRGSKGERERVCVSAGVCIHVERKILFDLIWFY